MKRAFVPICLYSNGFFLIKENLRFFLHVFSDFSEILFVVVDKLWGNNLLIKNKVDSEEAAEVAYQQRGEHIFCHVKNTIQDYLSCHNTQTNNLVCRWNELAKSPEYIELRQRIEQEFESNLHLKHYSDMFIIHNLRKMTPYITDEKIKLEHDYLFAEITMSIYLTEYMGYGYEIWEKPQSEDLPDPLDILYRKEKDSLATILCGKPSIRKQQYLSPILNKYLDRFKDVTEEEEE